MNSPLPFIPCSANAWGMDQNRSAPHPLFCHRWFADDVIITSSTVVFALSLAAETWPSRQGNSACASPRVRSCDGSCATQFEKCWQRDRQKPGGQAAISAGMPCIPVPAPVDDRGFHVKQVINWLTVHSTWAVEIRSPFRYASAYPLTDSRFAYK
jgi:hypothetical protein